MGGPEFLIIVVIAAIVVAALARGKPGAPGREGTRAESRPVGPLVVPPFAPTANPKEAFTLFDSDGVLVTTERIVYAGSAYRLDEIQGAQVIVDKGYAPPGQHPIDLVSVELRLKSPQHNSRIEIRMTGHVAANRLVGVITNAII